MDIFLKKQFSLYVSDHPKYINIYILGWSTHKQQNMITDTICLYSY